MRAEGIPAAEKPLRGIEPVIANCRWAPLDSLHGRRPPRTRRRAAARRVERGRARAACCRGARPGGAGAVGRGALRGPDGRSERAPGPQDRQRAGADRRGGHARRCRTSASGRSHSPRHRGDGDGQRAGGRHGPDAPAAADLGGVQAGRGRDLRRPTGREAVPPPAAGPRRSGGRSHRADHRAGVRRAGAGGRGGQDHRGRPRAAPAAVGRGAATPLREPVAHRRGGAAHGHRPGRGRRRGVGGGDRGAGGRDHRPAAPRPERRRDPLGRLLHAGPTGRAARPAAGAHGGRRGSRQARPTDGPARPTDELPRAVPQPGAGVPRRPARRVARAPT